MIHRYYFMDGLSKLTDVDLHLMHKVDFNIVGVVHRQHEEGWIKMTFL